MIPKKIGSGLIKWMIPIVIISWFISAAAAFEFGQLQWDNGITGTLKRDEVISYMGYSVKVVAFTAPVESDKYRPIPIEPVEPFVGLNISFNGTIMNGTYLRPGESYISPDGEFKVTAAELPSGSAKEWLYESYNPWVKLELRQRGIPNLELTIESDDEYISAPNTEIVLKATLKNTGMADATNVDMDIGTELPVLRGELQYHLINLKKGAAETKTVYFSTPAVFDLKTYDIYVNATGFDVKDLSYNVTKSKKILIAPQPQQAPSLKKSTITKMYLKDQMMVSIYFKNNANYELKNVSIVDTIPKGFKQLSNNSLRWIVNISPNGEWYFRYLLKPTEANSKGVSFPSATAEFKIRNEYYNIQSNRPETIVYGPRIDITKETDVSEINPGDAVTVTVDAVNSGSTPTMVTIIDNLPPDTTLINGSTTREAYLEATKDLTLSYTFISNSDGPITLPPAIAEYYELGSKGAKTSAASQEVLIRIKPPPTPVPTPLPEVESPVNYTENTTETPTIGDVVEPAVDNTSQPEQPDVIEPEPNSPSIDGNAVLNLLLDCNENIGNDSMTNTTSEICSSILAGNNNFIQ